jgi:hypothetical protein
MPTGYTSEIYDGKEVSFKDFALRCARNFGALITMRDEPLSSEIPEFSASDFYKVKLEKARAELDRISTFTDDEWECEARSDYNHQQESNQKHIAKIENLKERYNAMLVLAEQWDPPTPEHTGLKKFMCEQLRESIRFDADVDYYRKKEIKLLSGSDYREKTIEKIQKEIQYYSEENEKEIARTAQHNAWVHALKASLA